MRGRRRVNPPAVAGERVADARLLPLQQHVEEMAENLIGAGKIAGARRGILSFGDQGRQLRDRWPSLFLCDVQRANDQADRPSSQQAEEETPCANSMSAWG